jgi:HSP20 family protein
VTLPTGADEENVAASYRDGILEVRTPIKEATKAEPKRIAITKE